MRADADLEGLAAAARAGLVRAIGGSGAFDADPGWRAAFEEVPRHLFVPYYYVSTPGGHQRRWADDPDPGARERWLRGVYDDVPLATRLRDGELVSSSSQPSLMALMLTELGVREGHRVLEIGTGTGYNAALLAHRLGDGAVTTVDLDPEITESARTHLAAAGHRPYLVTGDGARGVAERAPYDRVLATCALSTVPAAWVAQCAPGGRILTPLATGLALLDVLGAGHAEGRFLATAAYFVPLRGGRGAEVPILRAVPARARDNDLFRFLAILTQGALEPAEAYALWEREGRPARDRYGLTVTAGRVWAWLDSPEGPYVWGLR